MILLSQKSEKLFCLKSQSKDIQSLLRDFFQDSFFYVYNIKENSIIFHLALLESFLNYAKKENLNLLIEAELKEALELNQVFSGLDYKKKNLSPYIWLTKPYTHQIIAHNFFNTRNFGGLFDEMGLGKTKIFIDLCVNWLKEKKIENVLIVCPKALVYTWQKEIQKHSKIKSVSLIQGGKKERKAAIKAKKKFYVVNYELLRQDFTLFKDRKFSVIILDEAHKIKNPKAKITKCIHKLKSDYRFVMTGTPICNRFEDLWSLLCFIRPQLFKNQRKFLSSFCVFTPKDFYVKAKKRSYKVNVVTSYKNLDVLKSYLETISLRRLKTECLDLPLKIYQDIYVDLLPEQQKYYDNYRDELYNLIIELDPKKVTMQNQLVKFLRLRQITSSLINICNEDLSAKYLALDELLSDILYDDDNAKVIIWSHFVKTLLSLNKRYAKYHPILYYGGSKNRERLEEDFLTKPKHKLFIANPQVAGLGLNLTVAQTAIYVDKSFSYMLWTQSQDRIHRIGISKSPQIISLIAKNTIDEHLEKILSHKQSLTDYMIDKKIDAKNFMLGLLK